MVSASDRRQDPLDPDIAMPTWLFWLQLGLTTTLAVLFVVMLVKTRQQKGASQIEPSNSLPLRIPTKSLDDWPDEWTCEALFAARCKDVKCEGTAEQFEKFKTLLSARFSITSIHLSGAGVGAAFAGESRCAPVYERAARRPALSSSDP